MDALNSVLSDKLDQVIDVLKHNKVTRAYAFGSVTKDSFNDESDIDLLIAFDENLDPVEYGDLYFKLVDELEKILKRPVDLITEPSLKNPYFIKSVNESKIPLYE